MMRGLTGGSAIAFIFVCAPLAAWAGEPQWPAMVTAGLLFIASALEKIGEKKS